MSKKMPHFNSNAIHLEHSIGVMFKNSNFFAFLLSKSRALKRSSSCRFGISLIMSQKILRSLVSSIAWVITVRATLDFASNLIILHFRIDGDTSELIGWKGNGWAECPRDGGWCKGSYLLVCINVSVSGLYMKSPINDH